MATKLWNENKNIVKKLKPEILGQAHVPKPLHGINPRTIMGDAKWQKLRQLVVTNTPYCKACGKENVPLDVHEDYIIDYVNASLTINEYIPLCKQCHMFIHTGFLQTMVAKKQQGFSVKFAQDVLKHGLKICEDNNIKVFPFTLKLAKLLKVPTGKVQAQKTPVTYKTWEDWRLLFGTKTYHGMSQIEWKNKYGGAT